MISSPSAQMVNAIAEKISVRAVNGKPAPAYGPTMGIATAVIALGIACTAAFGPEKRGRRFEDATAAGAVVLPLTKDIEGGFVETEMDVKKTPVQHIEQVSK